MPPVRYQSETTDGETQQYGHVGWMGMHLRWREYPYEWVEQRKLSVLRVLRSGPIDWLASTVELHPRADGGTRLIHRFDVHARGWFSRWLARIKIGRNSRREFERVYKRIDAVLSEDPTSQGFDPFEAPSTIAAARQRFVDAAIARVKARMVDSPRWDTAVLVSLGELLTHGSQQDVGRLRPLELARRWGHSDDNMTSAMLFAAAEGLLELRWEVHCPICRVPTAHRDSLADVEQQVRCEVCDVAIQTDLGHTLELTFNVHPDVRKSESRTFCIGGPAHWPSAVAQLRLAAGETYRLNLDLKPGEYQLRSRQLAGTHTLVVDEACDSSRTVITLGDGRLDALERLKQGTQSIELRNTSDREMVVRIERDDDTTQQRADQFSASRAAASELFRQLFPAELLAVDQPVNVPNMTFLAVRLTPKSASIDSQAFAAVQSHVADLRRLAAEFQGTLLKTVGTTSICVFAEARHAVQLAEQKLREVVPTEWHLRAAVQRGPAILATVNGKLEFFGEAFEHALKAPDSLDDDEIVVQKAIEKDLSISRHANASRDSPRSIS